MAELRIERNFRPEPGEAALLHADPAGRWTLILCWLAIAAAMTVLWLLGVRLNGDFDDILKLHEVAHLLRTGDVFDRTLPGILQPEPYVSHWPWIVDAPYAGFAAPLVPFMGIDRAVVAAGVAVPLLLLAPALAAYRRLIGAVGFSSAGVALALASLFAMRGFLEFAPGRVDYHNLQILILLSALALLLSAGRLPAFLCGSLAALSMAISLEFAAFLALVGAVYAFEFVFGHRDGSGRLAAFGLGMAGSALVLFAILVPPSAYLALRCDAYALPHGVALAGGGVSLALAAALGRPAGAKGRGAILVLLALFGAAALAVLFPSCFDGPYGALSDYVRTNQIERITQEKSLFERPEFVLSASAASMAALFVGALTPAALVLFGRVRDRAIVVLALVSLLALIQAIFYFRYFRYLPFFSGIGLLLLLGIVLPQASRLRQWVSGRYDGVVSAALLVTPGVVLTVAMLAWHLVRPAEVDVMPAAEFADSCDMEGLVGQQGWPADARLLALPNIGIEMLALSQPPTVVAVPHHPSALGVERAYRFLDPATADPRAVLEEAHATHVALCAWRGRPVPELSERYPFAAALMEGRPPVWLSECPSQPSSPIRIYARVTKNVSAAACPAP